MDLLETLRLHPGLYYLSVFVLGLIVGSFLNVVIHRLPLILQRQWRTDCLNYLNDIDTTSLNDAPKESSHDKPLGLAQPASRCPHCGHAIRFWENIPVLSYLFLRGRCSECQKPISMRYPFIELLSAVLVLAVALRFDLTWQAGTAMLLTWALIALSFIDLDHQYLPDNITLPFLWLGLLINLYHVNTDIRSAVWGAAAGYAALWSVYVIFKKLTGKEGMGYGDFKLLAMLGAWLGWQHLPAIILLSSFVGAIIGISLILLRRHQRSVPIPFGPYLAAAGWICLLWGETINNAYLDWLGAGL